MKKIIVLAVFLSIALGLSAAEKNTLNYVTAKGQTYFGEKIKMGVSHTRIINPGQAPITIDNEDVVAYMKDGKLYERLPLFTDNNKVNDDVFMEYITSRSGLRLYKYCQFDENSDLQQGKFTTATPKYEYSVFKDGKLYLKVDEKNAQSCLPFFGINVR